jgi:arabinogalactan endo-1,4-beta-galactosidase
MCDEKYVYFNGSPRENQAIFDFQNRVLPVSEEFKKK